MKPQQTSPFARELNTVTGDAPPPCRPIQQACNRLEAAAKRLEERTGELANRLEAAMSPPTLDVAHKPEVSRTSKQASSNITETIEKTADSIAQSCDYIGSMLARLEL